MVVVVYAIVAHETHQVEIDSPATQAQSDAPLEALNSDVVGDVSRGVEDAVARLRRISGLLRRLRELGRHASMDRIAKADSAVEAEIRRVIRAAPRYVVDAARDSAMDVIKALESDIAPEERVDLGGIRRTIERGMVDPRNLEEAADAIDALAEAIPRVPAVRKLTGVVLDELERRGVLGEGPLARIVELLALAAAGVVTAKTISGGGQVSFSLGGGDVRPGRRAPTQVVVGRDSLRRWAVTMQVFNPLWPQQALRFRVRERGGRGASRTASSVRVEAPLPVALRGGRVTLTPYAELAIAPRPGEAAERQVGLSAQVRFGSAPRLRADKVAWSLPYDPRLATGAALVLAEGPGRLRRWVRHDPIPASLRCAQPLVALREMLPVDVEEGFPGADDAAQVVRAWLQILLDAVGPALSSPLLAGLSFRFLVDTRPRATYLTGDGVVEITGHPSSPYLVLHELAHRLDDVLGRRADGSARGRWGASQDASHPLSWFARDFGRTSAPHLVEPTRRFVVQDVRASGWPDEMQAAVLRGPVPLVSALEMLDWSGDDVPALVHALSFGLPGDDPDESIRALLGRDVERSRVTQLLLLSQFLGAGRDQGPGAVEVCAEHRMRALWTEVTSPEEVFARFVDQAVRAWADARGLGFGPGTMALDVPRSVLMKALPAFRSCTTRTLEQVLVGPIVDRVVAGAASLLSVIATWSTA